MTDIGKCPHCGAPATQTTHSTFPQYEPDQHSYNAGPSEEVGMLYLATQLGWQGSSIESFTDWRERAHAQLR